MPLDSTLNAALSQQVASIFFALEIQHPAGNVRLLDAPGTLSFDGKTFVGLDPDWGCLASTDVVTDQTGDTAPSLKMMLQQANASAAVTLADPAAQGVPVTFWCGAADLSTMAVVGEPYDVFNGMVDTVTNVVDGARSGVNIAAASAFDYFFAADEGAILSDAFHESVWPGELGFEYVTDVTLQMPWGVNGTLPTLTIARAA